MSLYKLLPFNYKIYWTDFNYYIYCTKLEFLHISYILKQQQLMLNSEDENDTEPSKSLVSLWILN